MKTTNEITIMIKIRSGKKTPLDVSGYFYGVNDNFMVINNLHVKKSSITDLIIDTTKNTLKKINAEEIIVKD